MLPLATMMNMFDAIKIQKKPMQVYHATASDVDSPAFLAALTAAHYAFRARAQQKTLLVLCVPALLHEHDKAPVDSGAGGYSSLCKPLPGPEAPGSSVPEAT
jgi:hypothetical protein